jgi:uncharacterized protein YjbK
MPNLPISSREYKLFLNADRFRERSAGAEIFFKLIQFIVEKEGGKITDKKPKEERRLTSFLDTTDLALHRRGFALRVRKELSPKPGFQVDLKYRAPDRYLAAEQDLAVAPDRKSELKFEEDILSPFVSKFSHSARIEPDELPALHLVKQAADLFTGLKKLALDENAVLATVNDFTAREVVIKLCKFTFGDKEEIKTSLNFWYLDDSEAGYPLVAEFSFGYKAAEGQAADKLESFPIKTVEGAGRVFSAIQKQAGWLDTGGTTKTTFAIDG